MVKNNYLSHDEQKLMEFIQSKGIITNELVRLIFPDFSKNKINKLLHSLYKKKYLKRAIKDVYYNPEKLDNYYSLALEIKKGYVGLTSALRYYGLLDYEDFTIFIITQKYYKNVELENYKFIYLPMHDFSGFVEKDNLMISTPEKTFFDCFSKIRYVGYNNLTKAIYNFKDINWQEFLEYFEDAPKSITQKTGYILDLLKKETALYIPRYVLNKLSKNIRFPVKLKQTKSKSNYNKKWKVQDNIGKEKILSWWYQ